MRILQSLCVLSCFWLSVQAQSLPPQVAIIIDDIGYQKVDPDIIRLPYPLTVAVMPFTPNGHEMTALASQHGKEIMLHMPMEAVAQNHLLGKGALRRPMSKQQVQQALHKALDSVPQAIGINNHMGSLYTSLPEQMDWVIEVVAERQLYFIDSKTTGKSVVSAITQKHGVKSRSRDVFLDNDKSYKALDRQFNQLIQLAKQHGHAIAIGHPYPETYRYLKKNLPRLAQQGIKVVPASALLDLPAAPAQLIASTTKHPTHQPAIAKPTAIIPPTDTTIMPAAPPTLDAEPTPTLVIDVVEPVPELIPWHPPYLPQLPGFDTPAALPVAEPVWRRFYPQPAEQPAPVLPLPLLLR
ncbi:divergent polysaccharide deacetylase family protein [Rheinheimera sp. F8]|uniref:divergent polysaccharide deacetylase family protein n=1 Tax=Rheinheimera sp. F8 TaxID=1763998 RepID=UPI000B1DD8AF|nr:divergent polysaccharide deacetylase family protein [Rheinheimera sp. F8]